MAVINDRNMTKLVSEACAVKGDFAEIGVFKGHTFKRLSLLALALGRVAHGFDSFEGMAPPTERDAGHYPAGKLSIGGVENFRKIMVDGNVPDVAYRLHAGFIPTCFTTYDDAVPLSFALVDVDQFEPTLEGLRWAWPRLNYGGVLVCDDYFPGRSILASGAIDEWMRSLSPTNFEVIGYEETQLFIRKTMTTSLTTPYAASILRN